jgi:hypothetical protein
MSIISHAGGQFKLKRAGRAYCCPCADMCGRERCTFQVYREKRSYEEIYRTFSECREVVF